MPLPYQDLIDRINQTPEDVNLYSQMTTKFKTWINNQTRLNATNMNELVTFIQNYAKEVGGKIDDFISGTLDNFVALNAGWKVSPDVNGEVVGGELFNDYNNNQASGQYSHAEGTGTNASGVASHAQGTNTVASGANSTAMGSNTQAGYSNQLVIGQYNENNENNLFEIGNGSSQQRLNIFSVDNTGLVTGGLTTLEENALDTALTPKGYVDQEIERLDKNVWLGYIDVTSAQYNDSEQFISLLNQAVKTFTVDTNPPNGRDPKNGDQITIKITDPSDTDPQYPEIWMFRDPDPKQENEDPTPGTWKFFSSLQQLVDASTTVKGLVQIGTNINVSQGVISVPNATDNIYGVVKLGATIVNDTNNNLVLNWVKW